MTRSSHLLVLLALAPGCVGTLSVDEPAADPAPDAGVALHLDGGDVGDGGPTVLDDGAAPPTPDGAAPPTPDGAAPPTPDGGPPPTPDGGPPDPCAGVSCGANARCQPSLGTCRCDEGFVDMGGACVAPPPGDPATRTDLEVCDAWRAGHVENAAPAWSEGGAACDPGTLHPDGVDDTLRRINLFRWLAGLPPVSHDASRHAEMMECAWMMSVNGSLSHSPPSSWTCYTSGGASAAGRSNIALGYRTPGSAIDGYMADRGTMSLGHRRWILGRRLGSVEIGFAGRGQCLGVFASGGASAREWTAYPNQGFAPLATAQNTWSFHVESISLRSSTTVTVVRLSDGAPLEVQTYQTGGGGPPPTIGFIPMGWTPAAGESYRVTIGDTSAGDITYEVHLLGC